MAKRGIRVKTKSCVKGRNIHSWGKERPSHDEEDARKK